MKKITIVLTALLFATVSHPILAKKRQQKTKQQRAEIKKWRKYKSSIHPLQLKNLVEENYKLNEQVIKMQTVNEALEGIIEFKTQLLAQKEAQQQQESTDEGAINAYGDLGQGVMVPGGTSKYEWAMHENGQFYIKGVVFRVQIGAYKQRDLHPMLEEADTQGVFLQEQSEGLNRYTLMYFRDYWKADQFKKELRAMGLKDAFIVAFQDGERVSLKSVLSAVIQEKK